MSSDFSDETKREQYTTRGGWNNPDRVVATVVSAVAECIGKDAMNLSPLYEVVNPDALEEVFKPLHESRPRADVGRVEFTYEDCDVLVTSTEVTVQPSTEGKDGGL